MARSCPWLKKGAAPARPSCGQNTGDAGWIKPRIDPKDEGTGVLRPVLASLSPKTGRSAQIGRGRLLDQKRNRVAQFQRFLLFDAQTADGERALFRLALARHQHHRHLGQ